MNRNLTINLDEAKDEDKFQVVSFTGEFDKAGHSEIKEGLDSIVRDFKRVFLVFDFDNLKFINSEGIGYLMEIHTHLIKNDQKLVIIGLRDHIKDVFETIGINEIIPVFDDLDAFLNN